MIKQYRCVKKVAIHMEIAYYVKVNPHTVYCWLKES